jgi:hypothetical protein
MTAKCYKDIDDNFFGSDYVTFEEDSDDIYIENDYDCDPEEMYRKILEENAYIYNQLVEEFKN